MLKEFAADNPRPDLHADKCLARVQLFIRDEIERQTKGGIPPHERCPITEMTKLADLVDELVSDILRQPT
ncbi:MAG: hypothetical protein AAGB04_00340 [Pseudomonadota bacterium]